MKPLLYLSETVRTANSDRLIISIISINATLTNIQDWYLAMLRTHQLDLLLLRNTHKFSTKKFENVFENSVHNGRYSTRWMGWCRM